MKQLIKYLGIAVFCLIPLIVWADDGKSMLKTQCFSTDIKKQECICSSNPKTTQECYKCGGSWEDHYYDLVCAASSEEEEDDGDDESDDDGDDSESDDDDDS